MTDDTWAIIAWLALTIAASSMAAWIACQSTMMPT
jgi:hypothetical protein